MEQIESYKKEIESFSAADAKGVEEFRIKYLGTKGIVKNIMGEMKNVPGEKRKEFGQVLNEFKVFTENKYESLKESASNGHQASAASIDLTLPGDELHVGSRHPITLMRNRIVSIFQRLGFGMWPAAARRIAFGNNFIVFDDHGANGGIRPALAEVAPRQLRKQMPLPL